MKQLFDGVVLWSVFATLGMLHGLAWKAIPFLCDNGKLKPVPAYVIGMIPILIGITVVWGYYGAIDLGWVYAIVFAAGAGTVFPRTFEAVNELIASLKDKIDQARRDAANSH